MDIVAFNALKFRNLHVTNNRKLKAVIASTYSQTRNKYFPYHIYPSISSLSFHIFLLKFSGDCHKTNATIQHFHDLFVYFGVLQMLQINLIPIKIEP